MQERKKKTANMTNRKATGMGSLKKDFYNLYQCTNMVGRCTPTGRTDQTNFSSVCLPRSGPPNQESLGSPNSFTVPASRLLSYLPSLSSQANASRGLLGCQATVKVGDSHCTSHSLSPIKINIEKPINTLIRDHTH